MKKRIILLIVFVAAFAMVSVAKIKAGTGDNALGWLWGGGTELDGVFPGDGTNTNVRWLSMNNTNNSGAVDYGVNIPMADGELSGEAWSGGDESGFGLGYITFDSSRLGGCPVGVCSARRVGNNLEGWARFEQIASANAAGNSGGWLGWVSLSGTAQDGSSYGVSIDSSANTFSGYAWSDELGWIDFSRASFEAPKVLNVSLSASPNSCVGCSSLTSTLTASRENTSTTTGDITYEFNCDESDGVYDVSYTTTDTSKTYNCTYASTGTAQVRISQGGKTETKTINVSVLPAVCGDGIVSSGEGCDDGTTNNGSCPDLCGALCEVNTCVDSSWREVAP